MRSPLFCLFLLSISLLPLAPASRAAAPDSDIILREGVAIRSRGRMARTAFHTDPIEALIVAGRWTAPRAGDTLTMTDGTNRTWEPVIAKPDGSFTNAVLRGGYV